MLYLIFVYVCMNIIISTLTLLRSMSEAQYLKMTKLSDKI